MTGSTNSSKIRVRAAMSDAADQLRTTADDLGDARTELAEGDLDVDVDAPEEAPAPEAIVAKIDGQIGELQVALQELAANVDVMEESDAVDD